MQKRVMRIGAVLVAAVSVTGLLSLNNLVSATVPGTNQRVSLTSTGSQANNHTSTNILSANGKMVAFNSMATNILPSGGAGIFIRNLATGSIARVNVSTAGTVDNGTAVLQKISATGRYVLFTSNGTNLIDGATISGTQLYLRDTIASITILISQTSSGSVSDGTSIGALGVSSDGRFVAFNSNSTNLHPDSSDGKPHLYMVDRSDNTISILDRKTDGTLGSSSVYAPVGQMSCDGSFIAFEYGGNLIVGDTPSGHLDVYLLDRRGSSPKMINLTKTANAAAMGASISCNGDFIGFKTGANNLDPSITVPFVAYNTYRPYVYDRVNGTYRFLAVTTSNTATSVAICGTVIASTPCVELSDTGIGVFRASDPTLTGASGTQSYMRDIYAGTTELLSRDSSGTPGNDNSGRGTISADGTIVAYQFNGTNLTTGDTNGYADVYTSLTGY